MIESQDIVERLRYISEENVDALASLRPQWRADIIEAIATIKAYRAVAGKAQANPSEAFAEIRRQTPMVSNASEMNTPNDTCRNG